MKPSPSSPKHWGFPLFAVGLALSAAAAILGIPRFSDTLTWGLLGASAVLPFISFPRVPNFRLDMLALNASGAGLLWTKGLSLSVNPAHFEAALGLVLLLNFAASSLVPVRIKAGIAPQVLILSLCLNAALVAILGHSLVPRLMERKDLILGLSAQSLVALGLFLLTALLSSFFLDRDYGLGGGVTGLAGFGVLLAAGGGASFRPAAPGLFAGALLVATSYVWIYRLRYRVSYDPLMQIYNRAHADQILHAPPGENMGSMGAVAMVDLDHFKHLNDRHGHPVGDKVLHAAAQAVRKAVLPSGVCCRYGGEEIIIFLPETSPERAETLFEAVRKDVERLKLKDGRRVVQPTCSIGWSPVTGDMEKPVSYFVEKADKALYKAKEQGRNRVVRG